MDKLTRYIVALTNLYGMVHKEMVLAIYNRMSERKVTIDEVDAYFSDDLERISGTDVFTYGKCFCHEVVVEMEHYVYFMRGKDDKPYYVPGERELLKYVDDAYYVKAEAYERLHDYAFEHIYTNDDEEADYFVESILKGLRFGLSVEVIMSVEFERMEVEMKDEMQRKVMRGLIAELKQDARTWGNNGYTERELSEIDAEAGGSLGERKSRNVIEFEM